MRLIGSIGMRLWMILTGVLRRVICSRGYHSSFLSNGNFQIFVHLPNAQGKHEIRAMSQAPPYPIPFIRGHALMSTPVPARSGPGIPSMLGKGRMKRQIAVANKRQEKKRGQHRSQEAPFLFFLPHPLCQHDLAFHAMVLSAGASGRHSTVKVNCDASFNDCPACSREKRT